MRWIIVIIALLLAATGVAASKEQLVEVTANKLNVRASPSTKAPIVNQVGKGDRLIVNPVSNSWAAISLKGEIIGFISTKYVKAVERQNEIRDPALVLFLALLVIAFLVVAFRSRSNRKHPVYKNSETLQNNKEVTTASSNEPLEETSNVRRDFQSTYRTRATNESEARKKVQDFPMAKVEHVIDGDTIIVSNTWKKTKIRLDSIDCPENGQHWGDVAKAGLIKMIGGQRVRFEAHGDDHYGRLLATIYVQERHGSDWINVNEKMLVKGHAWVMRKYYDHLPNDRKDKLNRLEKWARTKKVGLWKTPNPIPPWKWRSKA